MGCFFGNNLGSQMGMLMLMYMTKMASNIVTPRAWIYTQFAIFVSSNTTTVIIAQAFRISFAAYTANIIVPVLAAAVLMLPFLLSYLQSWTSFSTALPFVSFQKDRKLGRHIPSSIPYKDYEWTLSHEADEPDAVIGLSQVMYPALDKASTVFGIAVMFTTLIVLMALTAANLNDVPVFWATLPAAFAMLCWDVVFRWMHHHQTRAVARNHHLQREAL